MSVVIQKHHLYTGSLDSETPEDARNALYQVDVLDSAELIQLKALNYLNI